MILILSEVGDYSTNIVIKWLKYYKKDYVRINLENTFDIEKISVDEVILRNIKNGTLINLKEITSYWYRRGTFNINNSFFIDREKNTVIRELNFEINSHSSVLITYLNNYLNKLNIRIGKYEDNYINKLIVLNVAKEIGLVCPESIVANNKIELLKFIEKNEKVITKPISQGSAFGNKSKLKGLTKLISNNDIDIIPDKFLPTLFQKMIHKKYELRIFYLNGKFYSMAIFSQNDEQTKVDFRNYNFEKPNRTVPYNLPKPIKMKLNKLMRNLKMNCGSIDLIYGEDNKYYFLEINPVGQFNQVTYPCNYKIEKIIANVLIGKQK